MTLPANPPRYDSWAGIVASIKFGERGWRAYALQTGLQEDGNGITADGIFGKQTQAAVIAFQRRHTLTADGIAGPATQAMILKSASRLVHTRVPRLPDGVLAGLANAEGANVLAATNWTQPGGVDCGPVQHRVYGPPYSMDALRLAFDPVEAFSYAATTLLNRTDSYQAHRASLSFAEALRLAVLAHNAPFMAEQIVKYGHLLTPDEIARWTTTPNGGHYTFAQWAKVYPQRVLEGVVL
jgi:hypothetical protein